MLVGERYGGHPVYYSNVIVHRDSPITRIPQLQGRSWAYNEPASHSGQTVTLSTNYSTSTRGPASSAASWRPASTSAPSGWSPTAESTRPRSTPRSWPWSPRPSRLAAALRVIGTFGPSAIQPVVTASRLPDQLKTAVRDLLLGLGGQREAHSARAQGFIQGFVVINNGDYDDIPAMLAAIYTTPPLGRPSRMPKSRRSTGSTPR